ncbi:MAG: hypothetical protein GVY25_08620 [Bacteroidetes bacterium]|jgi:hypothetical protein|nr:hypothetical protein [Bacteroidota bacterium]
MEPGFELIKIDWGDGGVLYTVEFDDEDLSEYEKFCRRPRVEGTDELEDMEIQLDYMLDERGYVEHVFKTEKYEAPECAYHKGRLRMYCLRYSSSVLVAGSGGYKPEEIDGEEVTRLQDVDHLDRAFKNIQYVRSRISRRLSLAQSVHPRLRDNCLQLTDEDFVGPPEAFEFEPTGTET